MGIILFAVWIPQLRAGRFQYNSPFFVQIHEERVANLPEGDDEAVHKLVEAAIS